MLGSNRESYGAHHAVNSAIGLCRWSYQEWPAALSLAPMTAPYRLAAAAGVLLAALAVEPSGAAGPTAKAALVAAAADAGKWQPDAALTTVSTMSVMPDGTTDTWMYAFYSPKTKKFLTVTVKGGKSESLEVRQGSTDPVGSDFIDSDKAMQEAKANGLKGKTPSMALNFMGNIKQPMAFWTVTGGFASGDVSVILEAKTGKLFMRNPIP